MWSSDISRMGTLVPINKEEEVDLSKDQNNAWEEQEAQAKLVVVPMLPRLNHEQSK